MALTLEDRLALQELLVRYAYGIDVGMTEDAFLALFTDDAVIDSDLTGHYEGHEGVRRFLALRAPRWGRVQVRHVITNFLIDECPEPDRARLRAYLNQYKTQLELPAGTEPKTELVFVGSYDCIARKVQGRWKLSSRKVHIDDFTPAKRQVLDSMLPGRVQSPR